MKKQGTFLGIPYDWRPLTKQRLKSRIWNKNDRRLLTPKALGWGYDLNFYELLHFRRKYLVGILFLLAFLVTLGVKQAIYVDNAHKTFESYYAFRGCVQLIKRTDTYGICKTNTGQTIKIVTFQGKWYLDGDLPSCIGHVCL